MADILSWPASRLVEAIRGAALSVREVLEASLHRIAELDPLLNAFVALAADEALLSAERIQHKLDLGEPTGPLCGLPVAVKDMEDVSGLPTTYGSVPFSNNVPVRDSIHVARLREADAVVLGKTNTPEFGYASFTKNRLFGITRNPWDHSRTPGGSSGGSAVAVAAEMVPLATGTDRGGSIRIPASYSGCFGLKPTFGRIPRGPSRVLPWSDLEVLGPLTRVVRDAALYLDAVCGYHPADKDSLPRPAGTYLEALDRQVSRLRIAWSPTLGYATPDRGVLAAVEAALRIFESLGHDVVNVDLDLSRALEAWTVLASAERYGELADDIGEHRDEFGRGFLARVERAQDTNPRDIARAQTIRAEVTNTLGRVFDEHDVLVTPATPTTAFSAEGTLPECVGDSPLEDPAQLVAYSYPFNLSGHPAASIPVGLTGERLPVGLQLIAAHHRDELVLQAAEAYEEARGWTWRSPPPIAAASQT